MRPPHIRTAEAPPVTFIHPTAPEAALVQPIRNGCWVKPRGGIWTSPQASNYGWREWCAAEDYRVQPVENEHSLVPVPGTTVAVIDSQADLLALIAAYPGRDFIGRAVIDFAELSHDFDGLWLTEDGQWATRLTEPGLYGWDCTTVLFFRWVFEEGRDSA